MIPSISLSSLSFKANAPKSVRGAYAERLNEIKTAQEKAANTETYVSSPSLSPIPMQGTGQKLDIIA